MGNLERYIFQNGITSTDLRSSKFLNALISMKADAGESTVQAEALARPLLADGFGNLGRQKGGKGKAESTEIQIMRFLTEIRPPFTRFRGFKELQGYKTQHAEVKALVSRFTTHLIAKRGKGAAQKAAEERLRKSPAPVKGFLLYGPTGTGKSAIAYATAREVEEQLRPHDITPTLLELNVNTLITEYAGEATKDLTTALSQHMRQRPLIVFLNEVDGLFAGVGAGREECTNMMLQWLEKIGQDPEVMIIMATNFEKKIDERFRRKGRIDKEIKIDYPEVPDKIAMFRYFQHQYEAHSQIPFDDDINYESAARMLKGNRAVAADIETFFEHFGDYIILAEESVLDGRLGIIVSKSNRRTGKVGDEELLTPPGTHMDFPKTVEEARKHQFETGLIDIADGDTPADYGLVIERDKKGTIKSARVKHITKKFFAWVVERFNGGIIQSASSQP